ncbi:MAG: endonuclease/exonuclease/phosphatase family protein [Solirubrobacterales bacterium]
MRKLLSLALAATVALTIAVPVAAADPGSGEGKTVRVMTRNLYLGANLGPGLAAPDLPSFVEANGGILRSVTATDFPLRSRALAAEIREEKPDLVGLQEVALWRTGPPSLTPVLTGVPSATDVRFDFLELLLDRLNTGPRNVRYEVAVVQEEFDLEAPANENGFAGDGPFPIVNAELNGRLTMRDVILARHGHGVRVRNPAGDNFDNLLQVNVAGVPLSIERGWTRVDAKVRGSGKFRFVNTHLEAFDDETQTPSIRQLQAQELVTPGGPAQHGKPPVILLGDLNSDDDTVSVDDQKAYRVLLDAGFTERSTDDPLSCCFEDPLLVGGDLSELDHQVDHVMTDAGGEVVLRDSSVTGLEQFGGLWPSDHAGVFSALRFR